MGEPARVLRRHSDNKHIRTRVQPLHRRPRGIGRYHARRSPILRILASRDEPPIGQAVNQSSHGGGAPPPCAHSAGFSYVLTLGRRVGSRGHYRLRQCRQRSVAREWNRRDRRRSASRAWASYRGTAPSDRGGRLVIQHPGSSGCPQHAWRRTIFVPMLATRRRSFQSSGPGWRRLSQRADSPRSG